MVNFMKMYCATSVPSTIRHLIHFCILKNNTSNKIGNDF